MKKDVDQIEVEPYKKEQYEDFIQILEEGVPITSWKNIYEGYGIDDKTLNEWRKTRRAQVAMKKNIREASEKMRVAGVDDWRMWEKHLKLLGIDAVDRIDLTTKDKEINTPYSDNGSHQFITEFNKKLDEEAKDNKFNKTN